MINFKLNGKPLQFPSSWEDITFNQYVAIMKAKSDLEHLSILSGIDYEIIRKAEIGGVEELIIAMSFLQKLPVIPPSVDRVGPYSLPLNNKGQFDIRLESLGQFEDMRQIMRKLPENDIIVHTEAYAKYVAIYLQKIRDKVYDPMKVAELEEQVKGYNAYEVLSAGAFFFIKLVRLSTGTPITYPHIPPSPKKLKRVLKSSARNSVSTRKSTK
jgi:hypothetical protein